MARTRNRFRPADSDDGEDMDSETELSAACKNATNLLIVRDAQETNDAALAASLARGE